MLSLEKTKLVLNFTDSLMDSYFYKMSRDIGNWKTVYTFVYIMVELRTVREE